MYSTIILHIKGMPYVHMYNMYRGRHLFINLNKFDLYSMPNLVMLVELLFHHSFCNQ